MDQPIEIPPAWDDVTPELMTAAISPTYPDAVVGRVTVVLRDDGTNRRPASVWSTPPAAVRRRCS